MNAALQSHFTKILLFGILVFSAGCGSGFGAYKSLYIDGDTVQEISNDPNAHQPSDPKLKFCSPLSFENVIWNRSMSLQARRSFAIALSISGHFEGRIGWANLTNNFDGQGMSAGLLNQTLGTGSLQPLLSQMRADHSVDFASSFSSANDASISAMLTQWQSNKSLNTLDAEEDWHPTEKRSSLSTLASSTDASVQWAASELYKSNGDFKADWKQQLQSLLQKPAYVSLQVSAAEKIHSKALGYVSRTGINDLRTYLLMFDIVVQNGSITENRFKEWEAAVKSEKLTSTTAILKKLVEIRLQDTKPEWVADVRSRKYALIDGAGLVHGEKLDLPTSYCYELTDQIQ